MFKTATAAALLIAVSGITPAVAQQGNPGGHFIENWDLDGDGSVSMAEATERRSLIFASFDADDNGTLSPEEYDFFDEARAADMAANGMGHGNGQGGRQSPAAGLVRENNDADGDGSVTLEEFISGTESWFTSVDRNGDGVIGTDDFGPQG